MTPERKTEKAVTRILIRQAEAGDEGAKRALEHRFNKKENIESKNSRKIPVKITKKDGTIINAESKYQAAKICGVSKTTVINHIDNQSIDKFGNAYRLKERD